MRYSWYTCVLAVAAVAGCDDSTAPTSTTDSSSPPPTFRAVVTTTNVSFPMDWTVFVPCANGGAGELVVLSGRLHEKLHVTVNDTGHWTVKFFDQPQGVSGVGTISGRRYRGTGVAQDIRTGRVDTEETHVNIFRMVGQGPGNNFSVHENVRMTVHANGEVTLAHDHLGTTCR
jgi:hypothetical protein